MWLQRNWDKLGKNQDNTDGNWDNMMLIFSFVQVGKAARGRHNPRSLPQSDSSSESSESSSEESSNDQESSSSSSSDEEEWSSSSSSLSSEEPQQSASQDDAPTESSLAESDTTVTRGAETGDGKFTS